MQFHGFRRSIQRPARGSAAPPAPLVLISMVLVFLPAGFQAPAAAAEAPASASGEVVLPQTFDKVWYRAGEKKGLSGLRAFKASGDLTLTREGIEFHSGKDSFSIRLANIKMVALGKLGRDVDTDWAVLTLLEGGLERIVAFKDGKAMGYGQRTPLIFHSLRETMRELGAAQFNAPAGYRPYEVFDYQVALIVPEGWEVHNPVAISVGDRSPWGTTLFASRDLAGGRELIDGKALRRRVTDSASHEFFLVREEIRPGMRCSGFKRGALEDLLAQAAADPLFQGEFKLTEAPRSTPVTFAGCEGLRVVARGRDAAGRETVLDLRIVAWNETLFTFGVRALVSDYPAVIEAFEPVIEAVRFAPAVE